MLRVEESSIEHLLGISGDMSRQIQNGTCPKGLLCEETLAVRKSLFYKETKRIRDDREPDETIVLRNIMQQNITRGKDLY